MLILLQLTAILDATSMTLPFTPESEFVEEVTITEEDEGIVSEVWASRQRKRSGDHTRYAVTCPGCRTEDGTLGMTRVFQNCLQFQEHYISTHTNQPSYKCKVENCGVGFTRFRDGVTHVQNVHQSMLYVLF